MPLKKGKSKETISSNIRELMHSYESKGKIGNVKPRSRKHAQAIAAAIAYGQARKSGAKLPKKTNPLFQGIGTVSLGLSPGGASPKGMPFLKK